MDHVSPNLISLLMSRSHRGKIAQQLLLAVIAYSLLPTHTLNHEGEPFSVLLLAFWNAPLSDETLLHLKHIVGGCTDVPAPNKILDPLDGHRAFLLCQLVRVLPIRYFSWGVSLERLHSNNGILRPCRPQ